LARDLTASILRNHPELSAAVEIHLIEPCPALAEKQRQALATVGHKKKVFWHETWETVPPGHSPCFFYSCELVDSFPVRVFRFRGGGWREMKVGLGGDSFLWQEGRADAESIKALRRWGVPEVENFTAELRPGAAAWVEDWSQKISHGLVVTLDYGFPAQELFSPARAGGTVVALRHHQPSPNPLKDPGQQDLTAHVNFTELEELGARAGWKSYGLSNFASGLTRLATPLLQQEPHPMEKWIRNFRHLTHPSFFGQTHKILVQGKGLPDSFTPSISPSSWF